MANAKVVEKVFKPVKQPVEKVVVGFTDNLGDSLALVLEPSGDDRVAVLGMQGGYPLNNWWTVRDHKLRLGPNIADALVLALVEFYGLPWKREG